MSACCICIGRSRYELEFVLHVLRVKINIPHLHQIESFAIKVTFVSVCRSLSRGHALSFSLSLCLTVSFCCSHQGEKNPLLEQKASDAPVVTKTKKALAARMKVCCGLAHLHGKKYRLQSTSRCSLLTHLTFIR